MIPKILFFLLLLTSNANATNWCNSAAGCWQFTEGTGTTVADNSPNSNTGNFKGSGEPAWNNASLPKSYITSAVTFDDSDDYIDCGSDSSLDNLTTISVTSWQYVTGSSYNFYLTKMASGAYPNGLFIYQEAWSFGGRKFSSSAGDWRVNDGFVKDSWDHQAFTYDATSTSNRPSFYKNGVLQASTNAPNPAPSGTPYDDSGDTLYIGRAGNGSYPFGGRITEMAIFGSILDATDINDIMNNGLSGGATGGWLPSHSTASSLTISGATIQ